MTRSLLILTVLWTILHSGFATAEPLRIFIRSGEKTHGQGAHDHPRFLAEWKPLLEARGAVCEGGGEFPTAEQLAHTDVLVLHCEEAGNIAAGAQRDSLNAFLKRGGGLVVIHGGSVSRDPDWYKTIIGGSWRFGTTKWLEAPMSLYFTDRDNPITKDLSNFDLDDEIYYDMEILPEVQVLAAAYTPNPRDTGGRGNKKAQDRAAEKHRAVNVYDIQPQIWTYERLMEGGATPYRAFVHIPGHWYRNFSHPGIRALLLRGIAWAGKRENVDELCRPDELGDSLRYVEGGTPRPDTLPSFLEVHPDFELSLVASEPLINKPINIDWDEKGRLWVCESPEYPNGRRTATVAIWKDSGSVKPGIYDRDPLDRISILSDSNGDGVMDHKKVFADKLELVTSSVFYKNGVIACSAPDIWFLEDTDGDEVADRRTRLYTNLGTGDTHAVINNMRWGRDGWIYATHGYSASRNVTSGDGGRSFGPIGAGVVRFLPDGSAMEQYASRGGNSWGLETTLDGEVFYTQATTGNPLIHVVLPESVLAKGKLPGVSGTNGLLPGALTNPAMHWEQQAYVQIDQVGRYTAAAGCVIYEGGAWPEKWNHSYFTTEPTVNLVGHFQLKPDGVTYTAAKEAGREDTEFIRSRNLWFRPIEVRTGPDGALYVVDFCNQAVIHNDTRGPSHGPANAAVRPDRDHYYGRIWKVQHKKAKSLPPLALDRLDPAGLRTAATSANKHTRETALRLLRENHPASGEAKMVGSAAVRIYEAARTERDVASLLARVREAADDWTLSALVAASADREVDLIEAALASKSNDRLLAFISALTPQVMHRSDQAGLIRLLRACSQSAPGATPLKAAVLAGLSENTSWKPTLSAELKTSLLTLLKDPEIGMRALSLIARWDTQGEMNSATQALISELLGKLSDSTEPEDSRLAIARSLIGLRRTNSAVMPALQDALSGTATESLKRHLLVVLGDAEGEDVGKLLVGSFLSLSPALRPVAFDQILKRSTSTQELLDAIEGGRLNPADLGPGNIARLRTHPDQQAARRANAILDKLNPVTIARNQLIRELTPEVEKAGDPQRGKLLYAACSTCHMLGDSGTAVGPALDGMGAHGPADLLIHIIDPNREVDPSYWAHNITLQGGESLSGVITSENAASITLATQAGIREIAKAAISKREDTQRSLMPEGFEALGAEGLRDLLAYICGEATKHFRIIDLSEVYTADTRSGLFTDDGPGGGVLQLPKTGRLTIGGVPFLVQDPARSRSNANVIVLKGGVDDRNHSKGFPQQVEVNVNVTAKKLHLLSGIGGWAFPAIREPVPVLKAEVIHATGESESFVMKNGVEFADYIRPLEVPGSTFVKELSDGTQVRWITLELKKPGPIQKLVLSSFDNSIAPVIVAITADILGEASAPPATPAK
jgi:uncharacterized protein